jgi:hypothetical protein
MDIVIICYYSYYAFWCHSSFRLFVFSALLLLTIDFSNNFCLFLFLKMKWRIVAHLFVQWLSAEKQGAGGGAAGRDKEILA